jgi:hypothetical protein
VSAIKLADRLFEENKSKAIIEKIQEGAKMVRFNLDFMIDHPEYDLVEFEFQVTKYTDGGTTIEFIYDKGVIKRVTQKEMGGKII